MRRTASALSGLSLAAVLLLAGCASGEQSAGEKQSAGSTTSAAASASVASSSPASEPASSGAATGSATSSAPSASGSAPSASSTPSGAASSSAAAASVSGEHNDADTMFAQMMIPHHQQAVEMADILLQKDGIPPQVRTLAEDVKKAQTPEIERMQGFLQAWGEGEGTEHSGHMMAGMMSPEELRGLQEADGVAAAKTFLGGMIAHHEGALDMARTEAAKGRNPEAVALAKDIESAQKAEIETMTRMLADLG